MLFCGFLLPRRIAPNSAVPREGGWSRRGGGWVLVVVKKGGGSTRWHQEGGWAEHGYIYTFLRVYIIYVISVIITDLIKQ